MLEHLGTLALDAHDPPGAVLDGVSTFAIARDGRFACLPSRSSVDIGRAALTILSADGLLERRVDLTALTDRDGLWADVAWDGAGRVLVLRVPLGAGLSPRLWAVDPRNGEVTEIPIPAHPERFDHSVIGMPDGFALLRGEDVFAFELDGTPRWSSPLRQGRSSADGATVLADGRIALLDRSPGGVQILGHDGATGPYIRLAPSPRYARSITAVPDGFLIVDPVDDDVAIHAFDAGGKRLSHYVPRRASGRPIGRPEPRIDAEGRVWVEDGHSLLRLDENGVVDRVIGDPKRVGGVTAVALGPDDRIHALSEHSGVVHVLAPSGELLHRCIPRADDVPAEVSLASLTVEHDGRVLVDHSRDGDGHLAFSPQGDFEGRERVAVEGNSWHALPGGGLLVLGWGKAWLLRDGERTVIERGRDGAWLRSVGDASVAPDGSFILACSPNLFEAPAEAQSAIKSPYRLHVSRRTARRGCPSRSPGMYSHPPASPGTAAASRSRCAVV